MDPILNTTTANSTAAYGDLSQSYNPAATYGSQPFPWNAPSSTSGPAGGGGGGSWGGATASAPAPTPTASTPTPMAPAPIDVRSQQMAQLNNARTQLEGIQQQLNQRTIGDSLADAGSPLLGTPTGYTPQTPFDEDRARKQAQREQLRLHQAEIDATNQIYDNQLNDARLQGLGRLGSTRALGARGGILGSDFAATQKQNQIGANNAEQAAIQAERLTKIGTIMGNVRDSVFKQMEDKRQAYTLGADALLANIAGQAKAKEDNINMFAGDLIAQGFDIADLDPEELQAFAKEANVSTNDLLIGYARAKKAATTTDDKKYTLKAGETLVNAAGETISSIPGEPVVYKEGDLIMNADGTTTKVPKTSAAGSSSNKVYSAKNLPGGIRSEILDDLQNSQAAKDGSLDVQTLLVSYPEVDTETVQELYDTFYLPSEKPKGGADGNWWTFWD